MQWLLQPLQSLGRVEVSQAHQCSPNRKNREEAKRQKSRCEEDSNVHQGRWRQFNPDRNPSLGCGGKENFIQCKTAQLRPSRAVKTAQLGKNSTAGRRPWGQAPRRPALLCAGLALCCSACPLSPARHLWGLSSARETQPSVSVDKESVHPH